MTDSAGLAAQPVEQPDDAGLHGDVERGRRLVGDQQSRLAGERRSRSRSAAACRRRTGAGSARSAALRVGDPHLVEQLDRPLAAPRRLADLRWWPQVLGELTADRRASGAATSSGPGRPSPISLPRTAPQLRGPAAPSRSRPPKQRPSLDERARAAAAPAARARTSSCRCRSRRRCRRPRPPRRVKSTPSTTVDRPARDPAAGRGGPRPRAAASRLGSPARERLRGSSASRRLSPRKLKASTSGEDRQAGERAHPPVLEVLRAGRRPSSPTPPSAAGRRGRGTRGPTAAGSRCRGRASRARGPGRRRSGSTSRTAPAATTRRAGATRCTYSASPGREHEAADDARVGRPGDDHEREHGVAQARPERPR